MKITFNGKRKEMTQKTSLSKLLKVNNLESSTPGIAVAINGHVISREEWATRVLQESDCVEIVHAVQGG